MPGPPFSSPSDAVERARRRIAERRLRPSRSEGGQRAGLAASYSLVVLIFAGFVASGGTTWAKGALLLLLGLGLLLMPPKFAPHPLAPWALVGVAILAGAQFLPSRVGS